MVRKNPWVRWVVVLVGVLTAVPALAQPVGTAFTYQGRLQDNGTPANGAYDLRFILYDAAVGGAQVGPIVTANDVAVTSGLFTVTLDFGAVFSGNKRFLEVAVRPGASTGAYTPLAARQELAPTPNAVNSSALGGQAPTYYTDLANHTGTLADARLSANIPRLDAANTFSAAQSISGTSPFPLTLTSPDVNGTLVLLGNTSAGGRDWQVISTGQSDPDGAGRLLFRPGWAASPALALDSTGITTNLNASNLASGTVPDARLSANIPRLNAANTFTASQSIAGGAQTPLWLSSSHVGGTWMNLVNSSVGGHTWNVISTGQGNGEGVGKLLFRDETAGSMPLVLDGAGRLGVGTPFPETRLQVNVAGSAGVSPSLLVGPGWNGGTPYNQGNQHIGIYAWTGRAGLTLANHSIGGWLMETDGPKLYFQRGWDGASGTAMTLDSTGNVGIGTTTPTAGLDVLVSSGIAVHGYVGSGRGGSFESEGSNGTGVLGYATSSGMNYGVLGMSSSATGYGVWASGRLGATGTKSFRIDHPDDPENKYLLHYSAESPDVINFYSDTATLDDRGEAVVELPHYFAKINTRPRYQLTAVGAPMPMLHVATEIDEAALSAGAVAGPDEAAAVCSFRIAGGAPGKKVSWEVKAIRNDRWVQKRGAPVEVEKEGPEKGTYQHPDLYGQPPEKGVLYDMTRKHGEPVAGTAPR